jgi:hypothetical protein
LNGILTDMRVSLSVPVQLAVFESVVVVMTRSPGGSYVAEYEPISLPVSISGVPVSLLPFGWNPTNTIDIVLRVLPINDKIVPGH